MKKLAFWLTLLSGICLAQEITEVGKSGGFYSIQRIQYKTGKIFIIDYFSLIALDVTNPSSPRILDSINLGDWTLAIDTNDSTAFVSYGNNLAAIDIRNPLHLTLISSYPTPYYIYDLKTRNNYIYCANFMRFAILHFDGEFNFVGALPTAGQNKALDIKGDYAYLGEDQSGLYIVQIDNPSSPAPLSYVDTPGWCVGVEVAENYAYIADASVIGTPGQASVQVVRIDDVFNPTIVGSYISNGGNVFNVFPVREDYLIVADGAAGIKVLSIANPSRPTLVSEIRGLGTVRDVCYYDNYIYAACEDTFRVFRCELGSIIPPDTIPPIVEPVEPLDGTFSSRAYQKIRFRIYDNTAINTASISIAINDAEYHYPSPELSFNGDTLVWTPSVPFENGEIVRARITAVSDTSGNPARNLPVSITFTIDRTPPIIFDPSPSPESTTPNLQPPIQATIIDSISGVDASSIRLTIDSIPVSRFTFSENRLSFIPFTPFRDRDTIYVCVSGVSDAIQYGPPNVAPDFCWRFFTLSTIPIPDTIPPTISLITPIPGMYSSCPRQPVKFLVRDNTEIDPYSIEIEANDELYTFPSSSISLEGDTLKFQPPTEWEEGEIYVEIVSLSDTAGNDAEELPFSVSFFVDYTPPVIFAPYPLPWSNVSDTIIRVSVTIVDSISGLSPLTPRLFVNGIERHGATITDHRLEYLYTPAPTDTIARVCVTNAQDRAWGCGPNIAPDFCWAFFIRTAVNEIEGLQFYIGPLYPNPFNSVALLPYSSGKPSDGELLIFDLTGKIIRREPLRLSDHGVIEFNLGQNAKSGVYFYELRCGNTIKYGKALFIK